MRWIGLNEAERRNGLSGLVVGGAVSPWLALKAGQAFGATTGVVFGIVMAALLLTIFAQVRVAGGRGGADG